MCVPEETWDEPDPTEADAESPVIRPEEGQDDGAGGMEPDGA